MSEFLLYEDGEAFGEYFIRYVQVNSVTPIRWTFASSYLTATRFASKTEANEFMDGRKASMHTILKMVSADAPIKVYLDDERDTPDGFHRTYTVQETIDFLKTYKVSHLSIDNDLGILLPNGLPDPKEEGFNVINWLEEELHTNDSIPCPEITMHSSNTGRKSTTLLAIRSINEKFSHRKIA